MKLHRQRKKRIDIADSGALSDLAFLLIIFFIVIAVFNVNEGFVLGLPRKNSTKIVHTEDLIKIALQHDGTITHVGEPIGLAKLEENIAERLATRPDMTLLLSIEPETPYQAVVDVVNSVRRMKVENFSFRMEEDAGE